MTYRPAAWPVAQRGAARHIKTTYSLACYIVFYYSILYVVLYYNLQYTVSYYVFCIL